MRICVLTFHKAYSYGACLQAYATWNYLTALGIECKFIDYENEYEARMRNGKWVKYEGFVSKGKIILKKFLFQYDYYCKKAYSYFHTLLPSIRVDEICENDILAVGSDQTWNPSICGQFDYFFFFKGYRNRKISLASSAGSYSFCSGENEVIKECLKKFSFISVREKTLASQLQRKCNVISKVILDPTLWLKKEEWLSLIRNEHAYSDRKYILVFVFDNAATRDTEKIIMNYKKKIGLPVYQIMLNTYKKKYCDKVISGPTPFEFVKLINDADFVITNSFHGVAFSINMNTPFVFVPVSTCNNDRMQDLLSTVGLLNRKVESPFKLAPVEMSFDNANMRLKEERNNSLEWIENTLRSVDCECRQ